MTHIMNQQDQLYWQLRHAGHSEQEAARMVRRQFAKPIGKREVVV
jgi:hypothetical protein